MPAPRVATAVLDARGSFKKNPDRKRDGEPEPTGVFPDEPPHSLKPHGQKMWLEIIAAVPAGVLSNADVFVVEIAAALLSEFRHDSAGMQTARIQRLTAELGKLGLSPSDRAKLSVSKQVSNPFLD